MDIGYARVSTGEQTLDLQLDALAKAGCGKVYRETASGAKADRPVLDEVLSYVRKGDTLVVWRLDRLGRSLRHLIEVVAALAERGIGFTSLEGEAYLLRAGTMATPEAEGGAGGS